MPNRICEQRRKGFFRTIAVVALGAFACGCSLSAGPPRLYPIEEEAAIIRSSLREMNLADFSRLDEASRFKWRNDWLAGRMYAMDMQYTVYEASLTRERQGVGFGAALATIGLTTASTLVTAVDTKDILTGTAGAITGARAAYDNDILFAHGVQWIQTQMRAQRARVAERLLAGMRMSTVDYPLAMALADLEEYYRAGTFTGGLISTSETVAVDSKLAEQLKADRVQFAFVATAAGRALRLCAVRPGAKAQLLAMLPTPAGVRPEVFLIALQTGQSPGVAQSVLANARSAGICP
jgi:hypothetical protein